MKVIESEKIETPMGEVTLEKCHIEQQSEICEMDEIPSYLYDYLADRYGDLEGFYYRASLIFEKKMLHSTASITKIGAVSKILVLAGRHWARKNIK